MVYSGRQHTRRSMPAIPSLHLCLLLTSGWLWRSRTASLLLHDDNERLILGGSAVHHQRLDGYPGILVAGEVDEIRRDDSGFAGLKQRRSASLDFHDKISFDDMQ